MVAWRACFLENVLLDVDVRHFPINSFKVFQSLKKVFSKYKNKDIYDKNTYQSVFIENKPVWVSPALQDGISMVISKLNVQDIANLC